MDDAKIFETLNARLAGGAPAALATVTAASGSTPRKEGAKMIVLPGGTILGTVGGGCVEAKARSACLEALLKTRAPRLLTVSLTDDTGLEDGDICGGTVEILVEPFFP